MAPSSWAAQNSSHCAQIFVACQVIGGPCVKMQEKAQDLPPSTCKECPGSCWLEMCATGQIHPEAFSSGSCFVGPGAQAP